jgi:hypothetical protein
MQALWRCTVASLSSPNFKSTGPLARIRSPLAERQCRHRARGVVGMASAGLRSPASPATTNRLASHLQHDRDEHSPTSATGSGAARDALRRAEHG